VAPSLITSLTPAADSVIRADWLLPRRRMGNTTQAIDCTRLHANRGASYMQLQVQSATQLKSVWLPFANL
jgi:hypothetical protein